MTIFALYQPRNPSDAPEAVPEKFSWFAFLLPPLWALAHGLWLEFFGLLALIVLAIAAGNVIGDDAATLCYLAVALLIGLEAAAIRGAALRRKGFAHRADRVASHADAATVAWLESGEAA